MEILANIGLDKYANAAGKFLLFGVALPNGIPEAIATMILVPAVMVAVVAMQKSEDKEGDSGSMILTIDVGNMNIKSALFEGETLVKYGRFSTNITYTSDEYGILFTNLFAQRGIKLGDVTGVAISSVVPTMNFTLEHMCKNYFGMRR